MNTYITTKKVASRINYLYLFAAVFATSMLATTAQGSTLTFSDRAAFNTAASSLGTMSTEGYESYANDLQLYARTITLNNFNVSYNFPSNVNGDVPSFGIAEGVNPVIGSSGVGPTAGTKYLAASYPSASGPDNIVVSFLFSAGIRAFGTDIKDLETANLTYNTSSGDNGFAASLGGDGNVQFFGIITDLPFTFISFHEPPASTGDMVVFDQTSYVVPIPAAAWLFSSALTWLVVLGNHRKG